MLRSLRIAALGMTAQQLNVDTIANNLANVNTTGYKKNAVEFQDLLYENINLGAAESDSKTVQPLGLQVGLGNRPVSTYRSFSQGALAETGNPLDLCINGNGFMQILRADGSLAYTRDGTLRINSEGYIVTSSGLKLYPEIVMPEGVSGINIGQNGVISVSYEDEREPEEIGQIELVSFINPAGLKAIGGNLYTDTDSSGEANFGYPGEEGYGTIIQGYLEKSNVDIVQEMINLIVAQRAYEINSKAIKTSDELLAIANQIKR